MSHDVVADALSKIMNAKRANKSVVSVKHHSKVLLAVLALAKLRGYIKHYEITSGVLEIEMDKLNACGAIKPRFAVTSKEIARFLPRYLPAKGLGIVIVSTPKGLMAHTTAQEKHTGGSLLAYFY